MYIHALRAPLARMLAPRLPATRVRALRPSKRARALASAHLSQPSHSLRLEPRPASRVLREYAVIDSTLWLAPRMAGR